MSDKKLKNKIPVIRTFAQDLEKYKNKAEEKKQPALVGESDSKNETGKKDQPATKRSDYSLSHHVSKKESFYTVKKPKSNDLKNNQVKVIDSKTVIDSGVTLNKRHDTKTKSDNATEKIIKQNYEAKIIRETKEHKPKTSFTDSLKKWWSNLTSNKKNKKHAYSVPKSTYRKGIVEKATSKTGAIFTNDNESLREKIKNRQTQNVKQSAKEISNKSNEDKTITPTITDPVSVNQKPEKSENGNNEKIKETKTLNKTETKDKDAPTVVMTNTDKTNVNEIADKDLEKNNKNTETDTIEVDIKSPSASTETYVNKNIGYESIANNDNENNEKNLKNLSQNIKHKKEKVRKERNEKENKEDKEHEVVITGNTDDSQFKNTKKSDGHSGHNQTKHEKEIKVIGKSGDTINTVTVHKEKFIDRININAIAMTTLFFALCLSLVYFGYKNLPQLIERYQEVTADKPEKSKAKKMFSGSDELKSIILTTTNIANLPNLILNNINNASSTVKIREIAIVAPDGSEISASYLFNLLNFKTKPSMRGEIKSFRFVSIQKSDPVLVLKFDDKQTIYGGLLDWETAMLRDLSVLYKNYQVEKYNDLFSDKEVLDYNTRVSVNEDGEVVLIYGFVDDNTVLIANNENLFMETAKLVSQ